MTVKNNFNYIKNKNITWNTFCISRSDRERLNGHRAMILWFTGLSGSGKSILVNFLSKELYNKHIHTFILDGDNIRHGLCSDLGFNSRDRHENIRRVGEVARLMFDAGLVVLAAFISPFCIERRMVRNLFPKSYFMEIFVDTPVHICEKRDPKGLYQLAKSGEIKDFTGIHTVYERPKSPELLLDGKKSINDLIHQLLDFLSKKCLL